MKNLHLFLKKWRQIVCCYLLYKLEICVSVHLITMKISQPD